MHRRNFVTWMVALLVLMGSSGPVLAGPKKINKCQTITKPGSYVVEKNLNAEGNCLVIAASFVTIDLGGFTLTGDGTGDGVLVNVADPKHSGIVVRNGTATNFFIGIVMVQARASVVEGVRAIANVNDGFRLGNGITVIGNTTQRNGEIGIDAGTDSIITGNIALENGLHGIEPGQGSTVTGNTAQGNTGDGIQATNGCTVTGNTARDNGTDGIRVTCPSNVIGNTATANTTNLVLSGAGCNSSNNLTP